MSLNQEEFCEILETIGFFIKNLLFKDRENLIQSSYLKVWNYIQFMLQTPPIDILKIKNYLILLESQKDEKKNKSSERRIKENKKINGIINQINLTHKKNIISIEEIRIFVQKKTSSEANLSCENNENNEIVIFFFFFNNIFLNY